MNDDDVISKLGEDMCNVISLLHKVELVACNGRTTY